MFEGGLQSSTVTRVHAMPFGATVLEGGRVLFQLWAPAQTEVSVEIDDGVLLTLEADGAGWHRLVAPGAAGDRYRFVLPDGLRIPDPASRLQAADPDTHSIVVDPASFRWNDRTWRGRPWHEQVLYELHVGAFTPQGTFAAAMAKLDQLAALGITAIEIMPLADFPGRFNWGYDGVLPFAPDSSYGTPNDLKALIDAAHQRGLLVLLDVVYNHFGPAGNYLGRLDPGYVTGRHKTPWGEGLNFDGRSPSFLRAFVLENALYWLEEFHLDGLRLDAIHAILDDSDEHLVIELCRRARAAFPDRHVHLIAENEENAASLLTRDPDGAPMHLTAQWNDDLHHVLHTAITGEETGYYHEYLADTEKLGRALAEGFVFQGEVMHYRGTPRGEPSRHLPPTAFVNFLQNHDQTGNRAFGERIAVLAPVQAVRAALTLVLLAPAIPMLFMGEEWGSDTPFPYFADLDGDLAAAIREGRRQEFARFPAYRDPAARARIPDPTAASTFASAKLDWSERDRHPHAACLAWTAAVLDVRRREIVPRIAGTGGYSGRFVRLGDQAVQASWRLGDGSELTVRANLKAEALRCPVPLLGSTLWTEGSATSDGLGPWSTLWSLEAA